MHPLVLLSVMASACSAALHLLSGMVCVWRMQSIVCCHAVRWAWLDQRPANAGQRSTVWSSTRVAEVDLQKRQVCFSLFCWPRSLSWCAAQVQSAMAPKMMLARALCSFCPHQFVK